MQLLLWCLFCFLVNERKVVAVAAVIDHTEDNIGVVAERLKKGEICAVPCDTIYGLSGIVTPHCSERIYEIKERPKSKSFIVLMTKEQVRNSSLIVPDDILSLWPCPLTAILASPDGTTTAVRVPSDSYLQALLPLTGPIYSTSVNVSGSQSLIMFDEIEKAFGDKLDFIVKDENVRGGMSSTMVDATKKPYRIIRQGSYEFPL